MARKKSQDEEKIVNPAVGDNGTGPEDITETLDTTYVEDKRKEMPTPMGKAETMSDPGLAGERPAPIKPVQQTPEELLAAQRNAMNEPAYTAEGLANKVGAASLQDGKPDIMSTAFREGQEQERRSAAEILSSIKEQYDRQKEEGERQIKADKEAARHTGFAELGSAIANLIGVGAGNAVSQQYKSFSQDWMKKADQDMREHRSRLDNLRQRQLDAELKMTQLKMQQNTDRMKFDMQREQRRYENEYKKAQIAYQQARTEAARQKAQQDAAKAEAEIDRIQAQVAAYEAQVRQRNASAYSSVKRADAYSDTSRQNADTKASGTANQNANRNSRTASQNMVDQSRAALNWSKASGQSVPQQPGWSMQQVPPAGTPAPQGNGGAQVDEDGFFIPNTRNKK